MQPLLYFHLDEILLLDMELIMKAQLHKMLIKPLIPSTTVALRGNTILSSDDHITITLIHAFLSALYC